MGAYEEVRDDVIRQHQEAVAQAERAPSQEGPASALSVPTVKVSGSQPAWLGAGWRQALAVAAVIGTGVGLAMTALLSDSSESAAIMSGAFAIIALIVAYFTVAGFGNASFSIGSGADDTAESSEKNPQDATGGTARRNGARTS